MRLPDFLHRFEAASFIISSMEGKLVVSFDFVNENDLRIVDQRYCNTLIAPVCGENVTINDYVDFQLALTSFLNCYLTDDLSRHFVSRLPIEISLTEQHLFLNE